MMDEVGRFECDPQGSGIDANRVWAELQAPLLAFAQADPRRFVTELANVVVPAGGWPAYGAHRTIANLLGGDYKHQAYDAILTVALDFLRANGVPNSRLSGYEWQFWLNTRGCTEPWLRGRHAPSADKAAISPLAHDQMRRIAQLTAASDSNVIYVGHRDGGFMAVVEARMSDEDDRRIRNDWMGAPTLHQLYQTIGEALQVPPFWADPELEPYFPLPRPTI